MAIFHQHFQVIGRSGRSANVVTSGSISGVIGKKSAVAASAYRSGTRLEERIVDVDGKNALKVHDYRNKAGVIHSEILAPDQVHTNAWVYCRQELWNKVQEGERYKNAQYCREFDVALPVELTQEENIELIRNYVDEFFVARGMVADLSVHCDNEKNPHAHVMLTMRELVEGVNGDWSFSRVKNRQWNAIAFLKEARSNWAERVNKELELRGFDDRISAVSYSELGISLTPTKHEGPARYISNSRLTAYNKMAIKSNYRYHTA